MPINLLTALKVIPWGDVITAAPGIVKGARKMFARTQDPEPVSASVDEPEGEQPQQASRRIQQLEATVSQLREQQRAAAALLETLAGQHAQVVQAIEILRARTRVLLWSTGLLGLALVGALVLYFGGFGVR